MTDRELLEFAAKAAGVPIYESDDGTVQRRPVWVVRCGGGNGTMPYEREWNPLVDDGAALRLVVTLGMLVDVWRQQKVCIASNQGEEPVDAKVEFGIDPYAATRRAIVRAAAEIGRGMK